MAVGCRPHADHKRWHLTIVLKGTFQQHPLGLAAGMPVVGCTRMATNLALQPITGDARWTNPLPDDHRREEMAMWVGEVIATNLGFTEGPVVTRAGDILVTSLSHARIYRCRDGRAEVFAETPGAANGATEGKDGRIYTAHLGGKQPGRYDPALPGGVQLIDASGTVTWLTQDPISPNDICFGPDGHLYVTDPTRPATRNDARLWRVDPQTGEAELLLSVEYFANGIGFGVEDDAMYVASTNAQQIVRYPLNNGRLGRLEVAIQMSRGYPDGFAFDVEGNVVIAAISMSDDPGEIQTWTTDGKLLDSFSPGAFKQYTNVAFTDDQTLIVTASDAGQVVAFKNWPLAGLRLHPFR